MGRKLIAKMVYVDPGKLAALRLVSRRTRKPVAELIRQGLDALLASGGELRPAPKVERFTVEIPSDLFLTLEDRATRKGMTPAELTTEIVEAHFSLAQDTK